LFLPQKLGHFTFDLITGDFIFVVNRFFPG